MSGWETYLAQAGFWLGAAWILSRWLRRDITGVGNRVREQKREQTRFIATLIDLHAEEPGRVRKLARFLYDIT